jgi:hypothetical protein
MNKTVLRILLLAIASLFLNSCGKSSSKYLNELNNDQPSPDSDVTISPNYNFASFSGTVWRTKIKIALADVKEYTGVHHVYLLAPKHFDHSQADYTTVYDTEIMTVLSPGVRVQMGTLIKDRGEGNVLWVTGTLIDETNGQRTVYFDRDLLVKNRYITPGSSLSTNWGVNPEMFEAVTNAP